LEILQLSADIVREGPALKRMVWVGSFSGVLKHSSPA
jgi:hypothetical protein